MNFKFINTTRTKMSENTDEKNMLECPVCFEDFKEPIIGTDCGLSLIHI